MLTYLPLAPAYFYSCGCHRRLYSCDHHRHHYSCNRLQRCVVKILKPVKKKKIKREIKILQVRAHYYYSCCCGCSF